MSPQSKRHLISFIGLALFILLASGSTDNNERTPPSSSSPTASQETGQRHAEATVPLSQIVNAMNQATMSNYGKRFVLRYEDGPFATVEVNPELWEILTPLQQKAIGTNFAEAFGRTGQVNCRVKVYGIEVGHISRSVFGGWKYEPR